jgi:NADH-quinone oxidoreductase subunit L
MKIVDASVDAIAYFFFYSGDKTRKMQTGNLSHYLNWMGVGFVLLLIAAAVTTVMG